MGMRPALQLHNSHTLEVKVSECATCHTDVKTVEDLREVRMAGSAVDYDGDGDVEEGISHELEGVQAALFTNIQALCRRSCRHRHCLFARHKSVFLY